MRIALPPSTVTGNFGPIIVKLLLMASVPLAGVRLIVQAATRLTASQRPAKSDRLGSNVIVSPALEMLIASRREQVVGQPVVRSATVFTMSVRGNGVGLGVKVGVCVGVGVRDGVG